LHYTLSLKYLAAPQMKNITKLQQIITTILASIIGAATLASSSTARAAIVFQDNFNRVGALNGSTPSSTAGSNWTATPGFSTDGTKVSAAFGLFDDFTSAAYVPMPVTITSGNIYTLSATMRRGLSTDNTAIMIFGFFDSAPSWDAGVPVDEGHAIAIAPRNNLSSVNTMLHGAVNASDTPVADGTNGTTFGVRLYETAPNNWSAVAVELSPTNQLITGSLSPTPISLARIADIHSIGMISGSLLPPYIDNFTLDVTPVPEPGILSSLLAVGVVGWLAIKHRRRNG
jgi:hypothetical protein